MNASNVLMGVAGLLASYVVPAVASRYGQSKANGHLFSRIRTAALKLVNGKDMDCFLSDYNALLFALLQLLWIQCLALFIFTIPMAVVYFLSEGYCDYFTPAQGDTQGRWIASHDMVFMMSFFAGTVGTYVWRRL